VIRVPVIEERLQDQSGRNLVDYAAMVLTGAAGLVEDLVRFAGGQALIPEVNREPRPFPQFGSEGLGALRARTLFAGKVEGISKHDGGDAEAPRQARQRAHILARVPTPQQGEDGLRGQPQFV
jgi:hypothetical protein